MQLFEILLEIKYDGNYPIVSHLIVLCLNSYGNTESLVTEQSKDKLENKKRIGVMSPGSGNKQLNKSFKLGKVTTSFVYYYSMKIRTKMNIWNLKFLQTFVVQMLCFLWQKIQNCVLKVLLMVNQMSLYFFLGMKK